MAKAAAPERGAKSRAVREFLKQQPNASVPEVEAGLKQQGIEVSTALISKIKYSGKGRKGRKKSTSTTVKKSPEAENGTAHGSKAQAIRETFKQLGRRAAPSQIKAALAEQGISVSFSQLNSARKAMRRGRGKQRAASTAGTSDAPVTVDHLLAAKKLVEQVGSIEAAQQAVQVFGKLTGGHA